MEELLYALKAILAELEEDLQVLRIMRVHSLDDCSDRLYALIGRHGPGVTLHYPPLELLADPTVVIDSLQEAPRFVSYRWNRPDE
jgi:hypothetical protein